MKHQSITLIIGLVSLTACGDAATDADLPVGIAPVSAADTNEPVTAEPDAVHTPIPTPIVVAVENEDKPDAEPERRTAEGMSYVLPDGWSVGAKRQMRLLTLVPPDDYAGAELAVSKWPGDVGGFAANIARWARQIGIQPPDKARKDFPQVKVGGTQSAWIELINKDADKAIVALWVPRGDDPDKPKETWTLKLTCKAEHAEDLAAAMRTWAESIRFDD